MNGINRRGMKVVCVQEIELSSRDGVIYAGPYPLLNRVYTVMGFVDNANSLVAEDGSGLEDDGAAVELLEVASPAPHMRYPRPIGWPIIMFRPAYEGKTDISIFAPAPRVLERA